MTAITKTPYYEASKVREAAMGRWLEVLTYLADSQLNDALLKPGKHVTCPIHGTSGKGRGDGFRLFKDVVNTGGGICNTCGSFHDGFELLIWLKGWDFRTTLNYVAEILQVPSEHNNGQYRNSMSVRSAQMAVQCLNQSSEPQPEVVATQTLPKVVPMSQPTPERLAEIQAIQVRLADRVSRNAREDQEKIERTWYESISLTNGVPGPLFLYWKRRGILLRQDLLVKGDNVRFHSALPYYDEDEDGNVVNIGNFPAMIAAIRDLEGNIISLHRTYLTSTGNKAKVKCPRKMMPVPENKTVTGASIQLGGHPTEGVLGIAEGIETAMSAMRVYRIPTWSSVSATILEKFEPPKGVKTILIWADKDKSLTGQRSAKALKDALELKGITVHILMPQRPIKGKSVDWNDVLVSEGSWGFPAWNNLKRIISGGAVCAF